MPLDAVRQLKGSAIQRIGLAAALVRAGACRGTASFWHDLARLDLRRGLIAPLTSLHATPTGNLEVSFMHLTNYAVNRKNASFVANNQQAAPGGLQAAGGSSGAAAGAAGSDSSKWYLSQLQAYLEQRGHCWDKVGK